MHNVSRQHIERRLSQGDARDSLPGRVEQLLDAAAGVPLILVLGANGSAVWEPLRQKATLLRRPISIGNIVDAARHISPVSGAATQAIK
jgi:hypothetical protein